MSKATGEWGPKDTDRLQPDWVFLHGYGGGDRALHRGKSRFAMENGTPAGFTWGNYLVSNENKERDEGRWASGMLTEWERG